MKQFLNRFIYGNPEGCHIDTEQTRLESELEDWKKRNRTLIEEIRQIEEQFHSHQTHEYEREGASLLLVCQVEYTKQLYTLLKQLREEDKYHEQILFEEYKKLGSLKGVLQEALNLIRKAIEEY